MNPRFALANAVAILVTAFALGAPAQPGEAPPTLRHVFAKGDCARCHVVPETAELPRTENCSTCHVWIRKVASNPDARAKAMEIFPKWERYERNVGTYLQVPSLTAGMARLDPAWVRAWIADPHDVRPYLPEGMPRFALSDGELDVLADAFAAATVEVPATPAPDPANVEAGRQLFESRGCVVCHALGGAQRPVTPFALAPDLAHARDRMSPDMTVAWITNPQAISPEATMPPSAVTEAEAIALRDYLFLEALDSADPPPVAADPVATTDPVTWAQVEERVIGKICIHCHMDPAQNEGRAGPGNAGGFGWGATGIELQTVEGVIAVADRIPAVLLRRRHEARRDTVTQGQRPATTERAPRPGMPLGLPPIPDEDISLILGWIEQGMPH